VTMSVIPPRNSGGNNSELTAWFVSAGSTLWGFVDWASFPFVVFWRRYHKATSRSFLLFRWRF
jgi:hypothetical protein